MRIAIADDSALFRSGLVLLLEASGARVTTQASSGGELIASIFPARPDRPASPDAVILDLRMPPTYTGEGIQAAAEIRARDAGIGILVLSTFAEASYASQLMERGRLRRRLPAEGQRHRRRAPDQPAGADRGG